MATSSDRQPILNQPARKGPGRRRVRIGWAGLGLAVSTLLAGGCREESAATSNTLRVFVSIPPQQYLVERIGGDDVSVSVLLPPGGSPATYEPTTRQAVDLSQAHLYFRIGVPFEKQVTTKIGGALQDLTVVDLREGIELREINAEAETHDDADEHDGHDGHLEPDGDHHHAADEPDPHTWMNPRLVRIQAETIRDALGQLLPDKKETFEANCRQLQTELDELDARLTAQLAPFKGQSFFVYHPCLGYFADAYGLKQVAIEQEGKQPSAKRLQALIDQAKHDNVRLIFVQPQFDRRSATFVAEQIGGAVIPLDPLARDYIQNLTRIAETIHQSLTTSTRAG